ncbi:MAG: ABC transporter permease [Streptomyces sp.]|nr:ABC transporter permease [Streptomyces sp.]
MRELLFVAYECGRMQYRLAGRHPMMIVGNVVQPVALLLLVVQRAEQSHRAAGDLVVAVLLTSFWSGIVWTAGGILRRDQTTATLGATLLNARDGRLVLVGRCLGVTVVSVCVLIVTGAVIPPVRGIAVELPPLPWLVAGIVGLIVSGTCLSVLLACVFLAVRHGTHVTSALIYPVLVLGGLLIPPSMVPDWLEWPAWFVSLSWIRTFMIEQDLRAGAMAVVVTCAYAVAGSYGFNRVLVLAQRRGTLELV